VSSRGHILVDTRTLIVVQVDHNPHDSFARSVTPTATRAWKRAIHRSAATQFAAYAFAVPGLGTEGNTYRDKCVSFVAFAPSHEDAHYAIDRQIEAARAALAQAPA
jgi:hypothetical protein